MSMHAMGQCSMLSSGLGTSLQLQMLDTTGNTCAGGGQYEATAGLLNAVN